jgi:hypothetical protein
MMTKDVTSEPLGLSIAVLAGGRIFPPYTPLPYTLTDLPAQLRPFARIWSQRYGWLDPNQKPRFMP